MPAKVRVLARLSSAVDGRAVLPKPDCLCSVQPRPRSRVGWRTSLRKPLSNPALTGGVIFDALLDAAKKYGASKPILEDQERSPLTYTDLIRASFALGPEDRGPDQGGRAGRGAAAVEQRGGRHLLRPAGLWPHAGDAQLHRRPAQHPRRGEAGRRDAGADLPPLHRAGQAARHRRRARGTLRDHLPRGPAQGDRYAGPPAGPGRLAVSPAGPRAAEAVGPGGDPVHLRQLRRAARRGADPGQPRRQRRADRPRTSRSTRRGCSSTPCPCSTASA